MGQVARVRLVIVSIVALLAGGCGSSVSTATPPVASASPSPSDRPEPAATEPAIVSATPAPSAADPFIGAVVVTVSDRLRVRSMPEVSDASLKYEPLLPVGIQLRVLGGPVSASGYVWYDVAPIRFSLTGGVDHGWVAMADHDGQPWIALAPAPISLDVLMSSVERAPANPGDAARIADSVTAFGLDLYREMLAEPELGLRDANVVFSPTSIALALAMARAGARGETASQIDAVLHTTGWGELGAGLNALDRALAARDGTYSDDMGHDHQLALKIANASFAQRGWSVEPAYLDAIAAAFGADLKLVDYVADHETARHTINAWVGQQTAGRIPELLLPPNVTAATRLYLVNAVYLKANWEVEFREDETVPRPFRRTDGSSVTVPTMHLTGGQAVPYLRGDGWQATELRYWGADRATPLAMTLILPDDLAAFESATTARQLRQIGDGLATERRRLNEEIDRGGDDSCGTYPYSLSLFMPRFGLETRAQLRTALGALGMPAAFDPTRADFTGIHAPESAGDTIFVGNVIHQANIDVDEVGTEAAAATAIGMDTAGCAGPAPAEERTLRLDRPFLFLLRDSATGAVLFMGRVADPSAGG